MADVPREADFVALSDQDDRWHPDKLETLLRKFTPGVTLAYSDMNITDETGRVKASTYWTTRDNNYTHFAKLILANTITGAASMFRRNLLDYLAVPGKARRRLSRSLARLYSDGSGATSLR